MKYINKFSPLFIILIGFFAYSNSFNCSFHFDDLTDIVHNKNIHNIFDLQLLRQNYSSRLVGYFSFALNYYFSKLDVTSYHLVNLIIHLINAILIWWLTNMILSSPLMKNQPVTKHKTMISLLTALLFVSHPINTQAVTYIVQRLASLATLFYLLSVALYVKGRLINNEQLTINNKQKTLTNKQKHIKPKPQKNKYLQFWLFAGSAISAFLGMNTKEITFTIPFSIILIEFCFLKTTAYKINFKDWRVYAVMLVFLILLAIVPYHFNFSFDILKPVAPQQSNTYTLTPTIYLLTQFRVLTTYIRLLFLPYNLILDYDYNVSNSLFELKTFCSFIFILSILVAAVLLFKKYRLISFGIFWFFITSAIECTIFPIPNVIFEYRTYLPFFGFSLFFVSAVYYLLWEKKTTLAISLLTVIIIINSFLTYARNEVWKNDITLWTDNVNKSPDKARPWCNLGQARLEAGDTLNALDNFNKSIEINPNFYLPYYNRGIIKYNLKDYQGSILDFTKSIAIIPRDVMSYNNRGASRMKLNDFDNAIIDFKKAISINPHKAEFYFNAANAFNKKQNLDSALYYYNIAINKKDKYLKAVYSRAIIYEKQNKLKQALNDYNYILEYFPNAIDVNQSRKSVIKKIEEHPTN